MDISDYDEVELVLEKIKSNFEEIDVLVNCAGMGLFQPFLESDLRIQKMFSVNVLGLIYLTQRIALMMAEKIEVT